MQYSNTILTLAAEAEKALAPHFARIDRIAFENTQRVMDAFREFRVSDSMFGSTSGYGYDDRGRDTLDEIWASVMGAEGTVPTAVRGMSAADCPVRRARALRYLAID